MGILISNTNCLIISDLIIELFHQRCCSIIEYRVIEPLLEESALCCFWIRLQGFGEPQDPAHHAGSPLLVCCLLFGLLGLKAAGVLLIKSNELFCKLLQFTHDNHWTNNQQFTQKGRYLSLDLLAGIQDATNCGIHDVTLIELKLIANIFEEGKCSFANRNAMVNYMLEGSHVNLIYPFWLDWGLLYRKLYQYFVPVVE